MERITDYIEIYKRHIQDLLDNKITTIESDLKELERYANDYNNNIDQTYIDRIIELREQLEDLQKLCVDNDINFDFIDNKIYFYDSELEETYKKYLSKELEQEKEIIKLVGGML